MSLATITHDGDTAAITSARVQIPAWGRWWADVDVQSAIEIARGASVVVAFAGEEMHAAVVAGGAANGRAAYRVVAGTGGWSRAIDARAYRNAAGVAVATVIADVAAIVGESVADVPATRVGEHYAVTAGAASRALNELAPRAWYVGHDRVTRFGARASAVYDGTATRLDPRPIDDVIELATDDVTGLVPGVIVDGAAPATDVEYVLTPERLIVRVFTGPRSSRELDALRRVLDALDPRRAYRAAYEYRVVTQDGSALNLQPVRSSAGMPDLERVPVRLSPGVRAEHTLGSLVTVVFLDGDPSRPRVITGDDDGAPGWMPIEIEIGESPALGVARLTDTVIAGPYAGTITGASARVKAGS